MKIFFDEKKSFNCISFVAVMLLAFLLMSCSQSEPDVQPTSTTAVPDSQTEAAETAAAVAEQSSQAEENQINETEPDPTETPTPEPTATTQLEETSPPTSSPENLPEQGDTEETTSLSASQSGGTAVEVFSLSNASQVAPEDILQEISFSSGAGGDAVCIGSFDYPLIASNMPNDAILHELVNVYTCGWQADEIVQTTVEYPDGTIVTEEQVLAYSELTFEFKTNVLNDPSGQYFITFAGNSGVVHHELNLRAPMEPQVYWNDDNTLVLYNFEPKETVRVFAYTGEGGPTGEGIAGLNAWQDFNVDQHGNLILQLTDVPGNWFAAVGDISGEVSIDYQSSPRAFGSSGGSVLASNAIPTVANSWPTSETGEQACNLTSGDLVTAGDSARIWSQPNVVTGSSVQSLNSGQQLIISGTPQWGRIRRDIDASGWWWEVAVQSDNTIGWIWQNRIVQCTD